MILGYLEGYDNYWVTTASNGWFYYDDKQTVILYSE